MKKVYKKNEGAERSAAHYSIRRSQLFGPYGIGSIMPCPNDQSIMVAGLDASYAMEETATEIKDNRLARHIGVSRLLSPSVDENIPAVRFPGWQYCPSCGQMVKRRYGDSSIGYCSNPACKAKRRLVPERFIVVCPEGHIDDFPIMEWVHGGHVDELGKHTIRRSTRGGSLALGDIVFSCSCGAKRSLNGASRPGALEDIGYTCKGSRPWLMEPVDKNKGCQSKEPLHVVQRGGSNVWYADVASAIYIPDGKDPAVIALLDECYEDLLEAEESGSLDVALKFAVKGSVVDQDQLRQAFLERKGAENGDQKTDAEFRWEEFCTLKSAAVKQKGIFTGVAMSIDDYKSALMEKTLSGTTLVSMLRETRALVGFTRLYPDANDGKTFRERRKALSRAQLDWTIAMQSTGEGIFLEFDKEAVEEWVERPEAMKRFCILQENTSVAAKRKGQEPKELNARFVLIHSIAHALILALSEECGYSPSSLRERIYCDKYIVPEDRHEDMLGLLVYTASGDSEGSLGGLVRAGRPGRFEGIYERAIENARWCSMDPVCVDSRGQGPDSCNLAACYSCLLVPETACENGNRLLDRALMIGTLDEPAAGFYNNSNKRRILHLTSDFENCTQTAGISFRKACEFSQALDPDERQLVEALCDDAEEIKLETPTVEVTFMNADGEEADATLAWHRSRVLLLSRSSRGEFVKAFGDFDEIEGWRVFSIEDARPDEIILALGD